MGRSCTASTLEPDAIARALEAVPGADLRLGLMENLPWPDASFDVVTSFNAVQYALDPEVALIEATRVVRTDGRIAICKWGHPAGNEFFAFLTSIGAGGVRGDQLPMTDPVEDAIRAARLEVLTTGEVAAPIEMADDAALAASLVERRNRAGLQLDRVDGFGDGFGDGGGRAVSRGRRSLPIRQPAAVLGPAETTVSVEIARGRRARRGSTSRTSGSGIPHRPRSSSSWAWGRRCSAGPTDSARRSPGAAST